MEAFVRPWWRPGLLCLLLALAGCARGPQRVARLVAFGSLVPFAASMRSALRLDNIQPHYLALSAPGLAVVLGLGLEALIFLLPGQPKGRPWSLQILWVGVVASLVVGGLPSPFSPTADWRMPMAASFGDFRRMLDATEGSPDPGRKKWTALNPALCVQGLRTDLDEGIELDRFDPRSRL